MTTDEIKKIAEEEEEKDYKRQPNAIRKGLEILEKYVDDVDTYAEHDVLYAGGDGILETMKEEDIRAMFVLNWILDDDESGFQHFT